MKRLNAIWIILLFLFILLPSHSQADVVILKNGQVIKNVTVKEEDDTVYCVGKDRTYYINKNSIESIIKTEHATKDGHIRHLADELIQFLPPKVKTHIYNYPRLIIAGVACILALIISGFALSFLWTNTKLLYANQKKRRLLIWHVKRIDDNEKSVLREFILQAQNTLEMPVEDKAVAGLIYKGILEKVGSKGEYAVRGLMLPLMISSTAKRHLSPKKIGMPAVLNDASKRSLSESRPKFIYEMAGFYKKLERKGNDYW